MATMEKSNEGNFIQLVRFRAETDTILSGYLLKAPKNAYYTIQNELLSVVGNSIRNDIINPRCACGARVTVVVLCVCVCVCVCVCLSHRNLKNGCVKHRTEPLCIKSNYLQNGCVVSFVVKLFRS